MALQYWVGDFFVDLSRNQVTQKTQSQTIAPKALAVLTYLAENQGRVVSYDELFSQVWPDTIVTPNTLQRSIAQLRKVLGEDSKLQSYIKTHAKQGYSLECDVRWHDETESTIPNSSQENIVDEILISAANSDIQTVTNSADRSKPSKPGVRLVSLIFGIIILGFIGYKFLAPTQPSPYFFGELRSLTATDNKEHSGIYSPDGEYIVFNRYSEALCSSSNVWAKSTKTQQEIQLTNNVGLYGSLSFSKDGKKLAFIETENCNKPINQMDCYKLMTLDFEKALLAPQSPKLLMECKNSRIAKSTWLNNNNVALLQKFSDTWQLASYSIEDHKTTVIYSLEDGNLIDYDYSVKDDLFALTSVHNDGHHYIEILKPDGQVLSSHQIEYPKEIIKTRFIYPNFTPTNGQLIFSTGRQLFTLSFEGEITNISLPLDEPMGSPIFHPDGKRMLMIKGIWDSDIATITRSQLTQTSAGQTLTKANNHYSIIERSILEEDNAIFQPNGELIAYKSRRSGDHQIWITDGSGSQQLSHFPMDSFIYGLDWAADGKSLLVNANGTLTQLTLDSKQKSFPLEYPVVQLFQWDSVNNSALLLIRIKGILKFVEFNLTNSDIRIINDKKVKWALKSESGQLIYSDHMGRFWQPGPAEDQLIEALEGKGAAKQLFKIKGNVVFGINDEFQLWSYDLSEDKFELLGNMPKNIDSITDINQTDILLSIRITAKKEVAELTLRQ